jgi:hypothetical protein
MAEHEHNRDLRGCPTAYECRDRLPELAAWAGDDVLKMLPIWQGRRLEVGQEYFDLDNPGRGPFVASGDTGPVVDHTYVCRAEVPEQAWELLATWGQPISRDQGEQIQWVGRNLGMGVEGSAAGDARPLPRG